MGFITSDIVLSNLCTFTYLIHEKSQEVETIEETEAQIYKQPKYSITRGGKIFFKILTQ